MTKEPPEIPNVTPIRRGAPILPGHYIDLKREAEAYMALDASAAPAEPTMRETLAEAKDKARGLTPYGYLMSVMRDEDADPYLRVMAAEALMPYCHKKE